jgi:tetratricopeptide (TPR) repeat protein
VALLSLVLGSIAGLLIALLPSAPQPPAPLPSPPLPVSPGSALPAQDAPEAAAALGGSPYLDLLKHYRAGEYELAVRGMAVLPEGRSADRVLVALESLGPALGDEDDPRRASPMLQLMQANVWAIAVPVAAALHLETGYSLMLAEKFSAARDHLHIARLIVDHARFSQVMKIRPDLHEARARFRRDIYLGVLWALQADENYDRLVQQLARVRDEYPDDGEVALALGAYEEYQSSSPVIRSAKPPTAVMAAGPWRRNARQMRLKSAEKYFRAALQSDSSLAEARLRLGRVLQQRGLLPEARTELEGVFAQPAAPPAIRYLASMFLVDVLDALGHTAASLARARDLVTRYPECQSAHLTLSSAYEAQGQRAAALSALAPLWKEEGARSCADPWWSYYVGQTWRMPVVLQSMRERVRGAR